MLVNTFRFYYLFPGLKHECYWKFKIFGIEPLTGVKETVSKLKTAHLGNDIVKIVGAHVP